MIFLSKRISSNKMFQIKPLLGDIIELVINSYCFPVFLLSLSMVLVFCKNASSSMTSSLRKWHHYFGGKTFAQTSVSSESYLSIWVQCPHSSMWPLVRLGTFRQKHTTHQVSHASHKPCYCMTLHIILRLSLYLPIAKKVILVIFPPHNSKFIS